MSCTSILQEDIDKANKNRMVGDPCPFGKSLEEPFTCEKITLHLEECVVCMDIFIENLISQGILI